MMFNTLNDFIYHNSRKLLLYILIVCLSILLINKYWVSRCKWLISITGNGIESTIIDNNKKGDQVKIRLVGVDKEALMISPNKSCGYSRDLLVKNINKYITQSTTALVTDGSKDVYLSKIALTYDNDNSIVLTGELLRTTSIKKIEINDGSLNSQILLIL